MLRESAGSRAVVQPRTGGEERLVASLRRDRERPCGEVASAIAEAVRTFEGEQGATDDITLVIAPREA